MPEEISELLKALAADDIKRDSLEPVPYGNPVVHIVQTATQVPGPLSSGGDDLGLQLDELRRAVQANNDALQQNAGASREAGAAAPASNPAESAASIVTRSVLKTVSFGLGPIGPIVSGLFKLFGSGGDPEEAAPLARFDMPASIRLDAALSSDRQLSALRYSQSGLPESVPATAPAAAPITVNIQAMDSRSFLDRSSEIAEAVRDAMLHSHSLNDVVADV